MRRSKRDKIKKEIQAPSTSKPEAEQHDLAYFIHDKLALIQEVFSVLSPKELKAMAPGIVSHLSVTELQELCLEELLGISSKRLCATLDGAEPPSNTESSSDEAPPLETISLDSISSDEAPLEEVPQKTKKHKHKKSKKHKRKRCHHHTESSDSAASIQPVTTISAFELLQNEVFKAQMEKQKSSLSAIRSRRSSDEVEIKEEPPEVLVISSDDEPDVKEIENRPSASTDPDDTVTKMTNNVTATLPQQKSNRKIKLNRTKSAAISVSNLEKINNVARCKDSSKSRNTSNTEDVSIDNNKLQQTATITSKVKSTNKSITNELYVEQEKGVKKKHKKHKKKQAEKTLSDPDEITLQLSDSEMRMLEEFGRKRFEKSSSSEESGNSSKTEEHNSPVKSFESTQHRNTVIHLESQKTENSTIVSKPVESDEKKSRMSKKHMRSDVTKTNVDITMNNSSKDSHVTNTEPLDNVTEKRSNIDKSARVTKATDKREYIQEIDKSQVTNRQNEIDNAIYKQSRKQILEEMLQRTKEEILKYKRSKEKRKTKTIDNKEGKFTKKSKTKSRNSIRRRQELSEGEISDDDDTRVIKNRKSFVRLETTRPEGEMSDDQSPKSVDSVRRNSNIQEKDVSEVSDNNSKPTDESDIRSKVSIEIANNDETPNQGHDRSETESPSKFPNKCNEKSFTEAGISNKHLERESIVIENLEHDISTSIENAKNENSVTNHEESVDVVIVDGSPKSNGTESPRSRKKSSESVHISNEESNYKMNENAVVKTDNATNKSDVNSEQKTEIIINDDDVYEISDDDSLNFEVDGFVILSKEPTTEEIEALSAKVDEMERKNIVTDEQIAEHERLEELKRAELKETDQIDDISWRDRYLQSTKVKKVMSVAKLFNALRKKNKEVKNKLEEVKHIIQEVSEKTDAKAVSADIEEGSIEHYQLLEGSTKYVDPVAEKVQEENKPPDDKVIKTQQESNQVPPVNKEITKDSSTEHVEGSQQNLEAKVTEEMAKDAKKLFKMYKRLVKYNDMYTEKGLLKKKKKKKKSKRNKSSKEKDNKRKDEFSKQDKNDETNVCSENVNLSGKTIEKCEIDNVKEDNDQIHMRSVEHETRDNEKHQEGEDNKRSDVEKQRCENDPELNEVTEIGSSKKCNNEIIDKL